MSCVAAGGLVAVANSQESKERSVAILVMTFKELSRKSVITCFYGSYGDLKAKQMK